MPPFNTLRTGLERPKVNEEDEYRRDWLEFVENLHWKVNPEKLMNFLLKNGPSEEEPWVNPKELAKKKSPEDAAQYLVENLASAFLANEPSDSLRD